MTDVTLTVAGEAGQGVQTVSEVLSRLLARDGYHVFAHPDVMSRIRGGHNFTRIRAADRPVASVAARMDVVLCLDEPSVGIHHDDLADGGLMLVDADEVSDPGAAAHLVRVPFTRLAHELGGGQYLGSVALGALCAVIDQPLAGLETLLRSQFGSKGRKVVSANLKCARAGFKRVSERSRRECGCRLPGRGGPARLLLTGNQAVGLGALAAGVRLFAGYPMSPATGIMEFLAARQDAHGLVMEQAEDEIAAVNICLGASYAGVRAMTATSGGGFDLMVEGLGFAGMAELPLVIVLCQRPGPATGFPTRTAQGELLFVLDASQDEFPRFVFAPGNAGQAFEATARAFELAGRFQVPAIVLSDQQLADSRWTLDRLPPVSDSPDGDSTAGEVQPAFGYRRYAVAESGVSPWLPPGTPGQLVRVMGSEHDESGLPTEDAANRVRMHDKRWRKWSGMREAFGSVESAGAGDERDVVVCFGSTRGAVFEAVGRLRDEGREVGALHLPEVWPFPREAVMARLVRARRVVTVEQNSTGQLARLLCRETRVRAGATVLRDDGRPFGGEQLAGLLRRELR